MVERGSKALLVWRAKSYADPRSVIQYDRLQSAVARQTLAGARPPMLTIILLSGGIDSAAAVNFYLDMRHDVIGLFVDYGQAASHQELESARLVAGYCGVDLDDVRVRGGQSFGPGEVRGRNAFLVLTALLMTPSLKGIVSMGIHSGTSYFDCSEAFAHQMSNLLVDHTDGGVAFDAPFLSWTKEDVYDYCIEKRVPIRVTHSCESGRDPICGTCLSCLDREALSARQKIADPT